MWASAPSSGIEPLEISSHASDDGDLGQLAASGDSGGSVRGDFTPDAIGQMLMFRRTGQPTRKQGIVCSIEEPQEVVWDQRRHIPGKRTTRRPAPPPKEDLLRCGLPGAQSMSNRGWCSPVPHSSYRFSRSARTSLSSLSGPFDRCVEGNSA